MKNPAYLKRFKKIQRRFKRHFASFYAPLVLFENFIINKRLEKKRESLNCFLQQAITRGISYFESEPSWTYEVLISLVLFVNKDLDFRLAAFEDRLKEYCCQCQDPHLRLVDKNYKPEIDGLNCPEKFDVTRLCSAELPIIVCLEAKERKLTDGYLSKLSVIDDNGGYGTTHILLGCAILKKYSGIDPRKIDHLIEICIKRLVAAQRGAVIDDLFCERTVLIQWFGYNDLIKPAWILRILKGQMENGGWYWEKRLWGQKANQHSTCLALAALIRYREMQTCVSPAQNMPSPARIGEIISLRQPNLI